jgi:hypothetical protein
MSLLKSKCDDHVPSLDNVEPKDIFEFTLNKSKQIFIIYNKAMFDTHSSHCCNYLKAYLQSGSFKGLNDLILSD